MATKNLRALTGNHVIILFDGKKVGALSNVRFSEDYGLEPIAGIGDIHAIENAPTIARYSISAEKVALRNDSMRDAGLTPEDGNAVLEGNVFDICVISNVDGSELRKYMGCSYGSGDCSIQKNGIISTNAQFMALRVAGSGL